MKIGSLIMKLLEDKIKKLGYDMISLSAQVQATSFYESLGYNKIGEIYYEEHCPHIKMIKNI